MSAQERLGELTVLEWSQERLANSERLAASKTGADRESWLEDVAYWRAIVKSLSELQDCRQYFADRREHRDQ